MERIPPSSYALIDALNTEFPERCAQPGQSMDDIQRAAGRREVVNMLLRLRAEETEDILSRATTS